MSRYHPHRNTPERTSTPRVGQVLAPFALQVSRQNTGSTSREEVPPKIEEKPFNVRVAGIRLVRILEFIRWHGQIRGLANGKTEPAKEPFIGLHMGS